MDVGIYIDGFNLYYGGRAQAARGGVTTGWKWLDLGALASTLATRHFGPQAHAARVVYCTAKVSGATNPGGAADQTVYLRALRHVFRPADAIELGKFYEKTKTRPLATAGPNRRPVILTASAPVRVKDANGEDVPNATFMVTVGDREEKGSDVNVATRLLIDTLEQRIAAAIVISNDSDLELPVLEARARIPVGVVNPNVIPTAGALRKRPAGGPGGHWEAQLTLADFTAHQLPDPCGPVSRPARW